MGKLTQGLIIGTAAAAAIGTYILYGPGGERRRRELRGWIVKMKGEVLDEVERIAELNREKYEAVVDRDTERYSRLKVVGEKELKVLNKDLKHAWRAVAAELTDRRTPALR